MGRGQSEIQAASGVFMPDRRGPKLSADERLEKAVWSVNLSKARGLGDQDIVRQIIKHCNLPDASPETVEAIAQEIILDGRVSLTSEELAKSILTRLAV